MATIRPFRGLRYDLSRTTAAGDLMAPPYDVVDAQGRAELGARSRDNCIHFILPEGEGDAKYARGAAEFRRIAAEALLRDAEPSIYVYHQTFDALGHTFVRKGFVCLIELTKFGAGPVLAHERTLAGPKVDRLALMRACDAHLELVFGMFSDPKRGWEAIVDPVKRDAVLRSDFDGIGHELWRVDDEAAVQALAAHLAERSIYIADGHHRYETMCAFRAELEAQGNPNAAFGMIYLSNLDDPGLVVFPTHRLVHGLPRVELPAVLDRVAPFFDVASERLPADAEATRSRLERAASERAAFGLSVPRSGQLHLLTLRADFDPAAAGLGALAPALQRLDVVLLHELVLERALGISKAAMEAKTNLRYYKSYEQSHGVAQAGDADTQLVCFMNPTPVADVRAVCDSGEVMPQKSTFFYPKIPNGLVFHDIES
jgi:uncharacterized protein (DUF1015 family)